MIEPFVTSILYAIKGGQLGHIPGFNKLREDGILLDSILDGKILSSLGAWIIFGPAVAIAWLAGVAPKMGRIVGNVGGYRGNWDADERPGAGDVREGWKLGIQRGVFMGAMLALATGNVWFIVAGSLFPATAWLGVSIEQYRTKRIVADWHWHEVIFGAAIGIPFIIGGA